VARAKKEIELDEVKLPIRQPVESLDQAPISARGWWIREGTPSHDGAARDSRVSVAPLVSTRSAWIALALSVVLFAMSAATCILRP
jgi:hypothetical protein